MPPRNRLILAVLATTAAILVGVALGYQPSGIGIHPAPTSTTASTRVPLGLRQGPTSEPAYVPHPAGNPPTRAPAYVPRPAGDGRAADGPAASTSVVEAERRPTGSGGPPSEPTTSAVLPSSTITEPTTTAAAPATTMGPTTTVTLSGVGDTVGSSGQ